MCLQTYNPVSIIAKEDIECYKIFDLLGNDVLISPYKRVCYGTKRDIIGKELIPDFFDNTYLNIDYSIYSDDGINKNCYTILHGIHAYTNYPIACFYLNSYRDQVICKCVIPKGSRYYKGVGSDYCAEKLIVKTILN